MDIFEALFWNVFNNKYLFNKIFEIIRETEWIKYKTTDGYNSDNRIIFKNIKSLNWYFKNFQYQLLKCKLQANEIEINYHSILSIFSYNQPIIKYSKNKNKIYKTKLTIDKENEIKIQKQYQLILLILDYKRDDFIKCGFDLILKIIERDYNNPEIMNETLEFIQTLLDEPYSIPITKNSVFKAISGSTTEFVEVLIKFSNSIIFDDFFKNNSISNAIKNNKQPMKMLELIINHPELYNPANNNNKVNRLDLETFLKIKSLSIRNKLMDLNYFKWEMLGNSKKFKEIIDGDSKDKFKLMFQHLIINGYEYLYQFYFDIYDEPVDGFKNDNLFIYYYTMYGFSVNLLKYLFSLDRNILSNIDKNGAFLPLDTRAMTKFKMSNEFIKLYSSGYKDFPCTILGDKSISEYIYSIPTKQEYDKAINSISNDCDLKNKFPKSWLDKSKLNFLSKKIIIRNIKDVDWIIENYQDLTLYYNFMKNEQNGKIIFKFENYKLLIQQKLKHPTIFGESNLNYPFTYSISNCDIKSLDYLNDYQFSKFSKLDKDQSPLFSNMIGEPSEIIKLLNYLNATGYKSFTSELFKEFLKSLVSIAPKSNLDFSKLKIDFSNKFENVTIQLFYESITDTISFEMVKLLEINGFFKVNKLKDHINIWNESYSKDKFDNSIEFKIDNKFKNVNHSCLFYSKRKYKEFAGLVYCTSNETSSDIIKCIEFLVQHQQQQQQQISSDSNLQIFESILNLLFKRLIRSNSCSIDDAKYVYSLLSYLKWFNLKHTLYHSFYYLGIKSLKFIKFIMSIPCLEEMLEIKFKNNPFYNIDNFNYENYENNKNGYVYNEKEIKDSDSEEEDDVEEEFSNIPYDIDSDSDSNSDEEVEEEFSNIPYDLLMGFDINKFSFEYIFNKPFQIVLDSLISNLIYPNYYKRIFKSCTLENYFEIILIFLLEIREFNLFFKHLNRIVNEKKKTINLLLKSEFTNIAQKVLNQDDFIRFKEIINIIKI